MSFSIDFTSALAQIRGYIARMEDPVPFYDEVGHYVVGRLHEQIVHTKMSPAGDPWAPWKPFTEEQRFLRGNTHQGIMWDTGHLLNDIKFEVDGAFEVAIGSTLDYAVTLQEGVKGKQEPRPLFGWADDDYALILNAATLYFNEGAIGVLQ
jgi:hypothetical protein